MRLNIAETVKRFIRYREIFEENSSLTLINYSWSLGRFISWFGKDKKMKDVTKETILEYKSYLRRYRQSDGTPYSHRTYYDLLVAFRNFLRYCHEEEEISTAPYHKVKLPKLEDPMVNYLVSEEVEAMIQSIQGTEISDLRDKAIIETLFSTGMRVGELLSLDRDKIDLYWREFPVRGKNKKVRPVFLSEKAADSLNAYLSARKDNLRPLFIGFAANQDSWSRGHRLTARSVNRILQAAAKSAGITKHVTAHVLRHAYATDLLTNGADIRAIQEALGHVSIKTTQIYTHITNSRLKDIHQQFHNKKMKEKKEIVNKKIVIISRKTPIIS